MSGRMMAKLAIRHHMRGHGFTEEQCQQLMGKLDWEKIKKYTIITFKIFIKYILPLLLMLEQPKGQPTPGYQDKDDIVWD